MKKIIDIISSQNKTISIEVFPPKTEKGLINLKKTIGQLAQLKPDFFSCTYGAGGGNRDKTFDIVEMIEKNFQIPAMAHLTCVLHNRSEIGDIVDGIYGRGIRNILALRGDPPQGEPDWRPSEDQFQYSNELCQFIRDRYGDDFSIGVAGFPEGHILCPDRDQDAQYLKGKIDYGADFVITQLFFNNQDYFDYVGRLQKLNIQAPIIPGVLPITNYEALLKFTQLCGASIPENVHQRFQPLKNDPDATLAEGIAFATEQCQNLLAAGAPGIHFYALNKVRPVEDIICNLKK